MIEISPEDAEEWTQSLVQIGSGWWRQIALAVKQDVPAALGMSVDEWREARFGGLALKPDQRPAAAAELVADGFTQEQAAEILGVSQPTISRDLASLAEIELPMQDEYEAGSDAPAERSDEPPVSMDSIHDECDAPEGVVAEKPESEPEAAPVQVEPLAPAEPGWHKLGEHLLYCGDSTDPEFVEACAGAAFAFADPPYNAGKAAWDEGFMWRHDYLADTAEIVAVTPGIAALAGFLGETEMPYKWSMAAEITNGMTAGALRFGNWICVTLFAHGSIYRKSKDHIRIPAATGDDEGGGHASRKPIRLLTALIELFTTKGDLVIDPFLGSGTTLMAAERTGRRCVGAELDPMHCADIIERYRKDKA